MSVHERTFQFRLGDSVDAPLGRLQEFLECNGYSRTDDNAAGEAHFRRGRPAASWFASDMSRLYTEVAATVTDGQLQLDYRITTTGQHLTDADRQFWKTEAHKAQEVINQGAPLVDLRPAEASRARDVTGEYRRTALWAAFIVFSMVVFLGLVADWFGIL